MECTILYHKMLTSQVIQKKVKEVRKQGSWYLCTCLFLLGKPLMITHVCACIKPGGAETGRKTCRPRSQLGEMHETEVLLSRGTVSGLCVMPSAVK